MVEFVNFAPKSHRSMKRITPLMLGFKSFWAAGGTIAGIEVLHAIRKANSGALGIRSKPQENSSTRWLHR